MDTEAFIRWALDDARTVEERYTTELLVESVMSAWHYKHKTGVTFSWDEMRERRRQRKLNPAYEPSYSEESLRRAAEIFPERKEITLHDWDRAVRDVSVLRFFPWIEKLSVTGEVPECAIFADLPCLRSLGFSSPACEDYRPLARCTGLKSLSLSLATHWPETAGLETLQELETLSLKGNLLVLPRGSTFPKVRVGTLSCAPLNARDLGDLPQLPACEFLTLSGVERLDGIEASPRLRNLTLTACVRDFAPLAALPALTCFTCNGDRPVDVAPLARVPKLHYAVFQTSHNYGMDKAPLRDFSLLSASPSLRELVVTGCPPLELEVAAINALLPPCDDLFLAATPRPIPPHLWMVVASLERRPQHVESHRAPDEPELIDTGMRACEGRWVARFAEQCVTGRIGHADWGKVQANGESRGLTATVECYEVVERLPEIVEAVREVLAKLRFEYSAWVNVFLRVPPPKLSDAQAELIEKFRAEQNQADFEARQRDEQEALERRYLYDLEKKEGNPIDPQEFAAPAPAPLPPPPWERDEDEDDDDDSGGIATKKKPDPPPSLWDDEHPLASNYTLMIQLSLDEIRILPHHRDIAVHLMRREPDEEIPDDPPAA